MVHGSSCKGNLPRMIHTVARGRFPPLPETGNKRSMVDVRDVVQAAVLAAANPTTAVILYNGLVLQRLEVSEWNLGRFMWKYLANYETYLDVLENLPTFIEEVYNEKRVHSGIDYLTPSELEEKIKIDPSLASRFMLEL